MYYVYIVRSIKDNRNYTGITNNLKRRLAEHDKGLSSTLSMKYRGPFEFLYYEKVEDRKTAREREKYFKSGSGREYIKLKTKHGGRSSMVEH